MKGGKGSKRVNRSRGRRGRRTMRGGSYRADDKVICNGKPYDYHKAMVLITRGECPEQAGLSEADPDKLSFKGKLAKFESMGR